MMLCLHAGRGIAFGLFVLTAIPAVSFSELSPVPPEVPADSLAAPEKNRTKPFYEGFPELSESRAYKQYQRRQKSDLSKLLFLIDRFAQSKVEIIYDGFHFPSAQAAGMARWFLSRNYNKQTPEEWIYQWCNTTVPRGKLILVKLPDGSTELGREVLLSELAALKELEELEQPLT